ASGRGWMPSYLPSLLPPRKQLLARIAVQYLSQVVHRLLLLAAERARHVDAEAVVDVAAALAVELGRPLTTQPLDRAVLGAGRHADALAARERGHLHGRPAD